MVSLLLSSGGSICFVFKNRILTIADIKIRFYFWALFAALIQARTLSIMYDWEADGGNKLNLPLGGGFAKTTKIGKMPLRFAAEIQNYVVSTDRFGPEWLFKFTVTPVMPSKYTRH